MSQLIKYLPCKHENLSSIFRSHLKSTYGLGLICSQPQTCPVNQAGAHRDLSASSSQVLGLMAWATTPSSAIQAIAILWS